MTRVTKRQDIKRIVEKWGFVGKHALKISLHHNGTVAELCDADKESNFFGVMIISGHEYIGFGGTKESSEMAISDMWSPDMYQEIMQVLRRRTQKVG